MACSISIGEVKALLPSGGTAPDTVRVAGTASECQQVVVTVDCHAAPGTLSANAIVQADGSWTVDLKIPCPCDETLRVVARCEQDPNCRDDFSGDLECKPGDGCPGVVVEVDLGDTSNDDVGLDTCNPDGTHTVTLHANITPPAGGGPVVSQWDFGDGAFAPASTALVYSVDHDYAPPGPYTARLGFILPADCPPIEVTVGELTPCDCPELTIEPPEVAGCAGSGGSVTLMFTATSPQDLTGCSFKWDFGDGTPDVTTSAPQASHTYTSPGTYAVGVVLVCGECTTLETTDVQVPPCCPVITGLSETVDGCADGAGNESTVTFVVQTDPPSASGTYEWDFGDGSSTETTTVPTASHNYGSAGTKTVAVTYTPENADETGCETSSDSIDISVPVCTGPPPPPPPPDEGGGCKGLRWAMVLLTILAGLALYIAICVPGAGSAFGYIAAGLAIGAAVLGVIWGIFCPKPCGWGWLLSWQVSLGLGIGALYFATCCPWLWLVGGGLVAAGLATLGVWVKKCEVTFCQLMVELAVVLSGVVLPVLGWLAGIPFLAACLNPIVAAVVSTISGAVAISLAGCAS